MKDVLMIAVIVVLLAWMVYQDFRIRRIVESIDEISKGNFNCRIRIHGSTRTVRQLTIHLNRLVDEFQQIVALNKRYEEDRKKMISNISHDFRTPLTSMLGYVEMLQQQDVSEQERAEYLKVVHHKGMSLRHLIEEFFRLSKIESADITLDYKQLNITELLRQSLLQFLKDFERAGIEPVISIPEKDIYIEADEKSMMRIMQNLISNSLTYGSEGGVIGIGLNEMPESVVIEVWDRGKGIRQADIPFVFERLYTVEKFRNSGIRGSGLGLTIVKKLAEKHAGRIEVSSIPDEKTAFEVTLPKKVKKHVRNR